MLYFSHGFNCFLLFLSAVAVVAGAQTVQPDELLWSPPSVSVSFRPSVAIVIGIFAVMFSLTLLLLMYAKFCRPAAAASSSDIFNSPERHHRRRDGGGLSCSSGIDKTVIESLPFFRFSALRGARDGLECAVCLSRFGDAELLRLLPKCKHAFHLPCVDRWLEAHSSCPLCRSKVNAADAALFSYSDRLDDLFVERETETDATDLRCHSSSRFSIGGSFRKSEKLAKKGKAENSPVNSLDQEIFHKFKHKIIVSDVVFKNRWSDVNSADIMALNSDMLRVMSSRRFAAPEAGAGEPRSGAPAAKAAVVDEGMLQIKEEMERKRSLESKAGFIVNSDSTSTNPEAAAEISAATRSMSEITNLSRFKRVREPAGSGEEKVRRLWLPIARRTVQWLAGRERRAQPLQDSSRGEVIDIVTRI
ncbi:E3 ubiquitin-protein ligase ATL42-like [Typha angustifolia]|uniref:E3 ubiquitin-protein ligase ATL42-like n=1 Tax=Typha angustifolia TaxID=59011 RepID=UPI003C2B0B99